MFLDTIGNLHIKLEYQNEEYKNKLITLINKFPNSNYIKNKLMNHI